MHSTRDPDAWAMCTVAQLASGCSFRVQWVAVGSIFPILAAALSVPRTLTTLVRDTRCESEGPIWPSVCPFCETFLGPGPWLQPPVSAAEGNVAALGLWSYGQERKRENWRRFHPFHWQRVKENSLKIFVRRGAQAAIITWKVYGQSLPVIAHR